MPEEGHHDFQY